jgi:hypothetical protein
MSVVPETCMATVNATQIGASSPFTQRRNPPEDEITLNLILREV